MSGRIWVVEENEGTRYKPVWRVATEAHANRAMARLHQQELRFFYSATRVVQYVRQGGAK